MKKREHVYSTQPNSHYWLDDLMQLVTRFSGQNIEADLGSMTQAELWAMYLRLRRHADAQAAG